MGLFCSHKVLSLLCMKSI